MNYFFRLDSCKIVVMQTEEEKYYDGTGKQKNRQAAEKGAAHAWHKSKGYGGEPRPDRRALPEAGARGARHQPVAFDPAARKVRDRPELSDHGKGEGGGSGAGSRMWKPGGGIFSAAPAFGFLRVDLWRCAGGGQKR